MSPINALAPRLNPDLFTRLSEPAHAGKVALADDDWCGTVPHRIPVPTPGPSPFGDDGWCGTVPHKFPFPTPSPSPWVGGDGYCGNGLRHLPVPPPPTPWADIANRALGFR
jgi:hypothetical protein